MAEKNDPSVLAAMSDASSANEDRKQARASLLPSLSGRSEYLGSQGNGKLSESRFVTNDGVHVYRDWAVVHQDFSPGALSGVGVNVPPQPLLLREQSWKLRGAGWRLRSPRIITL